MGWDPFSDLSRGIADLSHDISGGLADLNHDVNAGLADVDKSLGLSSTVTSVSNALADLNHDVNRELAGFDSSFGISATLTSLASNPLPTLAAFALTSVTGLPPSVSMSIVNVATGKGSMEDILKSAAMSYISGAVGNAVGNAAGTAFSGTDFATKTLSPALAKTLTSIVTSASGDMAVAALKNQPLNQILAAGMNSAITSYVTQGLTKQLGLTDSNSIPQSVVRDAIGATTSAILSGQDVGKAITQSVIQTTLSQGIKRGVNTIVSNSETIKNLSATYNDAKSSVQNYFTETLNPQYKIVEKAKQEALDARTALADAGQSYRFRYEAYTKARDYAESYVQSGPNEKTKNQVIDEVNAMVPRVNEAAATLKAAGLKANSTTTAYNSALESYNPLLSAYQGLAKLARDAFTPLDAKSKEQNVLLAKVATQTTAYEAETENQAGAIAKELAEKTLTEAKKVAIEDPIAEAYKNSTGRDASPSEIALWSKKVAANGIDSVLSSINNSKEAVTYRETTAKAAGFPDYETSDLYDGNISSYKAVIDPIKEEYQKQVGRDITDTELKTLVKAVENVGYPAVVAGIADSQEAKNYKASNEGIDADTLESNKTSANQQIQDWVNRSPVVKESWSQMPSLKPGEDMTTLMKSAPKAVTDAFNKELIKNSEDFSTAFEMARTAYGAGKTFNWRDPDTGKTSSFSTSTKEEVALQPFDAKSMSRSGLGGAAQAALNAGKTSFTWVDGSIYKVPDAFSFLKGANQSSAENKRLLEAGVVPVKSNGQTLIDQLIATGKAGLGDQLQAYGNAIALATGSSFNNAMINIGAVIEQQGKNQDIASIKAQEANINAAMDAAKNPNISWFDSMKIVGKAGLDNPIAMMSYAGREIAQEGLPKLAGTAIGLAIVGTGAVLGAPVAVTASAAFLTARGVSAVMDGFESFGSNGAEAYNTLIKAGVPEAQAREKALWTGATAAALVIPAEFIADKALFKHYLDSVQGGVKEYAVKYGSTLATQALSEGLESAGENAILQYNTTGKIGVNEALSNGMFGAMIAVGTTGGMLTPAGIKDSVVIGKDIFGKPITFGESLSGSKTIDLSTIDSSAIIGKSVGGTNVTLGSLAAIGLDAGLDIGMISKVFPASLTSDSTVIGVDADGTSHTLGQIKQEVANGSSSDLAIKNVFNDAGYVTQSEGVDLYQSAFGQQPTQEQLQAFIGKPEADVQKTISADQTALSKEHETAYRVEAANQTDLAEAARLARDGAGQAAAENAANTAKAKADQIKALVTAHPEMAAAKTPSEVTADKILAMTSDSGVAQDLRYDLDKDGKITAKDAVLGSSGTEIRTDVRADGTTAYATPKDIQDAIAGIQFPAGITPADVTQAITNYMSKNPSITLQQVADAITSGTSGLATDAGVKTSISDALKGVATKSDMNAGLAQTEKSILTEVAKNEKAGMTRDAALQAAIDTVAATQKTDTATLTSKLAGVQSTLGTEISNLQTGLAQTQKDILAQVAINEKAGMTRDAALQSAINTVATTQKTDTASLLTKLGTTEAALKTQIATQVTSLDTKLSAAIADAKAAGLQGDAALQSAINKVAADQKTTAADILTQMGKSTAELKTQFASDISGLSKEMQTKYDTLSQAQKDAVDAQVQQGKDLTLAITESAAGLQSQISGLSAEMQTQYGALTQAQKDAVDAQVQQGKDLTKAITDTASGLQTQITGLSADMQSQYSTLTQAQKDAVASQVQQGKDLAKAITDTASGLQSQITGLGADAQAKYAALTAAQKLEVDARVQQGVDLTSAINAAQTKTETQIGTLSADLQTKYNALTKADQDIVNTQIQQGIDTKTAIDNATKTTTEQITNVKTDLSKNITDVQTQFNTRVDELVKQGKSYQDATQAALGELNTGVLGLQTSVTDIKAAQAAEAAKVAAEKTAAAKAAKDKAAQQNMMSGLTAGANYIRSKVAPAAEETARPWAQLGLTSTGGDNKFESALGSFLKDAEAGFYDPKQLNEQQQQAAPAKKELDMQNQQGNTNYFSYGNEYDLNEVLAENPGTEMLYSKAGGLATPLFAGGGKTHKQNYAGGGLNVIQHEGKPRIDFRTGNAVTGPGDGQSDDIPAMLADGEFVFPADVVSALGNGSTKAGSDKLYDMMHSIRAYHRSAKPKDLPPPAKKSPLDYLKKTA